MADLHSVSRSRESEDCECADYVADPAEDVADDALSPCLSFADDGCRCAIAPNTASPAHIL